MKKLTQDAVMEALEWTYNRAIEGVPGVDSAVELAQDYLQKAETPEEAAKALVRWQVTKAGTSGFLAGLGGLITMPLAIPANVASVMFLQVRMIAAIAYLGGHDVRSDQVKTLVYVCLAGNGAKDILKDVGIVLGTKLTQQMIKGISGRTLILINKKVGFRLFTKFGQTGVVNLGKAVPLMGGIVGASFDAVTTRIVGRVAISTFCGGASAGTAVVVSNGPVVLDDSSEPEDQAAK